MDNTTITFDGIFGKIEIKHRPRVKVVDVDNYNDDLARMVPLESVLKASGCDSQGYAPECYIASKDIEPIEDDNENLDIEFKIKPVYSAEGSTRLESLQNLYKLLAEYKAYCELSVLEKNNK